ncbi:MAG: hypothetical protein IJO84_07175, partial [Butyricimonas sp.]|nr:hypothetical protein [Butyricimonas sp.]
FLSVFFVIAIVIFSVSDGIFYQELDQNTRDCFDFVDWYFFNSFLSIGKRIVDIRFYGALYSQCIFGSDGRA